MIKMTMIISNVKKNLTSFMIKKYKVKDCKWAGM